MCTQCWCTIDAHQSSYNKNNLSHSHAHSSQQCNSTYRPSLKVIVQRFVQQCPFAAPLRAHQRNIDIVISPCEPLAPCGNSHCVGGHGGQTGRRSKHPLRMKKSPAEQPQFQSQRVKQALPSCSNSFHQCTHLTSPHNSCAKTVSSGKRGRYRTGSCVLVIRVLSTLMV